MKQRIGLLVAACMITMLSVGQTPQEQKAIKNLCGCFEVEFKYAETFSPNLAYQFAKPYYAAGVEWVVAEETSDKKWVLQHLLVVQDTIVIKHWREDWEYEKKDWWIFDKNATWKKTAANSNDIKGSWTQTVWEIDDAPRYQGSSKWMYNNGKLFWENRADAPLPRREFTKRSDYNVLERGNTIVIDKDGWTHEQDNRKIKREDGKADLLIAEEKGFNVYRKTDEAKCKTAKDWWEKNHTFWNTVRKQWDDILKDKQSIQLVPSTASKTLNQSLAELQKKEQTGNLSPESVKSILLQFTK